MYDGWFKFDVYDGQGTLTKGTGEEYQGVFAEGQLNGHGTWTSADQTKRYDGNFVNFTFEGQGKMTYPKAIYNGEWKSGLRSGTGTATYPDGKKYVGPWENGK